MLLGADSLREHGLVVDARFMAIYPGKIRKYRLTPLKCSRAPISTRKPDAGYAIVAYGASPSLREWGERSG
eukprot:6172191-Pleurochrysis_carterae.AAC.2